MTKIQVRKRKEVKWDDISTLLENCGYDIKGVYVHRITRSSVSVGGKIITESEDLSSELKSEFEKFLSVKFMRVLTKVERTPFIIYLPENFIVTLPHDLHASFIDGGDNNTEMCVEYIKLRERVAMNSKEFLLGDSSQIQYMRELWDMLSQDVSTVSHGGSGIFQISANTLIQISRSGDGSATRGWGGVTAANSSTTRIQIYDIFQDVDDIDVINEEWKMERDILLSGGRDQDILHSSSEQRQHNKLRESIEEIMRMMPDKNTMLKRKKGEEEYVSGLKDTLPPESRVIYSKESGAQAIVSAVDAAQPPPSTGFKDRDGTILLFEEEDDTDGNGESRVPPGNGVHGPDRTGEEGPSPLPQAEEGKGKEDDDGFEDFAMRYTGVSGALYNPDSYSAQEDDDTAGKVCNIGLVYVMISILAFFKERGAYEKTSSQIVAEKHQQLKNIESIVLRKNVTTTVGLCKKLSSRLEKKFKRFEREEDDIYNQLMASEDTYRKYQQILNSSSIMKTLSEEKREELMEGIVQVKGIIDNLNIKLVKTRDTFLECVYQISSGVKDMSELV